MNKSIVLVAIILATIHISKADSDVSDLSSKDARIIGGISAAKSQFPFNAAILDQTSNTFKCGGTIIDKEWVLTSASCLYNVDNVTVLFNDTHLKGTEAGRFTVPSVTLIVHEGFNTTDAKSHNIGLVKLATALNFTAFVTAAKLPSEPLQNNVTLTLSGWGAMNGTSNTPSNTLRSVTVHSISNSECTNLTKTTIPDDDVCATGTPGTAPKGTCLGDDGSGLIQDYTVHPVVVGIANFVTPQGCQSGNPSGFTRVNSYVTWINKRMGKSSSTRMTFSVTSSILFFVVYVKHLF